MKYVLEFVSLISLLSFITIILLLKLPMEITLGIIGGFTFALTIIYFTIKCLAKPQLSETPIMILDKDITLL